MTADDDILSEREALEQILETDRARELIAEGGRPEIFGPHVPLSWVPREWVDTLKDLLTQGVYGIVQLPSTTDGWPDELYLITRGTLVRSNVIVHSELPC
jgi:hypothetical protein